MSSITLYTTTGCPLCERYRDLLTEKSKPFTEKNTTENPDYLDELEERDIFVVPTVIVDDKAVAGFRPNSLLELL